MPEKPSQPTSRPGSPLRSDQPQIVPKGKLSQEFRILEPEELERSGLRKSKDKSQERNKETGLSLEKAQEIMKTDFLGPEAVEKTLGFKPEVIPTIQFSEYDLEKAKELAQMLVLRVDQTSDGQPLTMKKMIGMLKGKIKKEGKGAIILDPEWDDKEEFFNKDTPTLSWALVSKELIPDSTNKNYLQQTEQIVQYLTDQVFKDIEIPAEYQEAIDEFEAQKAEITASSWEEAARILSNSKINQLTRQSTVDALYDWLMYLQINQARLMESQFVCTYSRSSVGKIVGVGYFGSFGADVNGLVPDFTDNDLGVAFSRSL